MNISIKSKIIVLCCLFLVLFIPSTIFVLKNLQDVIRTFQQVVYYTDDVLNEAHLLNKLIVDMETGQRGFVITGKEEFLEPYNEANKQFDVVLKDLMDDLADKPHHLNTLEKIEHLRYRWIGAAGEPEIKARRLIQQSIWNLNSLKEKMSSKKGKISLEKIKNYIDVLSNKLKFENKHNALILIQKIKKVIKDTEISGKGFAFSGKHLFLDAYYNEQINFKKHIKEIKKIIDKQHLKTVTDIEFLYNKWLIEAIIPEIDTRIEYEKNPRSIDDLANILAIGTGKKIMDNVRELMNKFISSLTKETHEAFSKSKMTVNLTNTLSITISIIGILLSILLAIILGKSIINPIKRLIHGTQIIGEGNLNYKIKLGSKDEFRLLANSFNQMAENLEKSRNEIIIERNYTHNIIKSLMDMLIAVNSDGTIKTVNQSVINILGYTEQELINKPIAELIAEEEEVFRDGTKLNMLIKEGLMREYSAFVIAKSGEKIPVLLSGNVLRDKQARLIGMVLSIKDSRDSKLVKELRDTQYQLVQSGKLAALGEMSSGLAHEINNPLFLIKGFNNRIKVDLNKHHQDVYEEVSDYMQEVNDNCERIMRIVKHFRDFSRISEQDFESISINNVISKSFILLNEQLKLRSINVKQILSKEDHQIIGNENQLEQVFINLITNARDSIEEAHEAKGGDLVVCTRREGKLAIIEFSDNGTGIDDEQLKRLFDPFYTTKEVGKGTGLGLSISHGIIADHKGKIICKSNKGEGARFIVSLPLYQKKTFNQIVKTALSTVKA